jgi:hypothetical protein
MARKMSRFDHVSAVERKKVPRAAACDQQCAKGVNKRIDKGADLLNSVLSEARQFFGL